MTYLQDLSPYGHAVGTEDSVLSVGWLDSHHPFPVGETSQEFREKLADICQHPVKRYFGSHECEFCKHRDRPDCIGDILVYGTNIAYVSPALISHYVTVHDYLPPPQFIAAVLSTEDVAAAATDEKCSLIAAEYVVALANKKSVVIVSTQPEATERIKQEIWSLLSVEKHRHLLAATREIRFITAASRLQSMTVDSIIWADRRQLSAALATSSK